jgi:hypothetical protein
MKVLFQQVTSVGRHCRTSEHESSIDRDFSLFHARIGIAREVSIRRCSPSTSLERHRKGKRNTQKKEMFFCPTFFIISRMTILARIVLLVTSLFLCGLVLAFPAPADDGPSSHQLLQNINTRRPRSQQLGPSGSRSVRDPRRTQEVVQQPSTSRLNRPSYNPSSHASVSEAAGTSWHENRSPMVDPLVQVYGHGVQSNTQLPDFSNQNDWHPPSELNTVSFAPHAFGQIQGETWDHQHFQSHTSGVHYPPFRHDYLTPQESYYTGQGNDASHEGTKESAGSSTYYSGAFGDPGIPPLLAVESDYAQSTPSVHGSTYQQQYPAQYHSSANSNNAIDELSFQASSSGNHFPRHMNDDAQQTSSSMANTHGAWSSELLQAYQASLSVDMNNTTASTAPYEPIYSDYATFGTLLRAGRTFYVARSASTSSFQELSSRRILMWCVIFRVTRRDNFL